MTLLSDAVEAKKYDTRVMERNLQRGLVNQTELNKIAKELPNDEENAEWVNVDELDDGKG